MLRGCNRGVEAKYAFAGTPDVLAEGGPAVRPRVERGPLPRHGQPPDPRDPAWKVVVAGELSWGDEPDGRGFQNAQEGIRPEHRPVARREVTSGPPRSKEPTNVGLFSREIHIGGPVPGPPWTVLSRHHGRGRFVSDYEGAEPARDALVDAIREGAIVNLYDDQACGGQFADLEAFLVEHGIHFNGRNDAHYECDAENVFYRGSPGPVRVPATQGGESLVACRDILAVLDDPSLGDGGKLRGIRDLVAPPQAAPLEPIRLV